VAVNITILKLTIKTFIINLYRYWLTRGEPEGKNLAIRAPLNTIQYPVHDNPPLAKRFKKRKHAALVQ